MCSGKRPKKWDSSDDGGCQAAGSRERVKHVKPRLFNLTAAGSLVLCVATVCV